MLHFSASFVALLVASVASAVPLDGRTEMSMQQSPDMGMSKDTSMGMSMDQSKDMGMGMDSKAMTETAMAETSSAMAETSAAMAAETTMAASSYSTPSYGSGSSQQSGSSYNDCVSQCMAQFGSQPGSYSPPPEMSMAAASNSSGSSSGSGTTHTVIVAPTQGVLRYVPPILNASVGDTIMFQWNAKNHTVTKSSLLTPCNKSQEDPVFASGTHDTGFTFTQQVNDTNTTWFFCGTPGHCQKGMFGLINPPMAPAGSNSSLGSMMASMMSNNSDLSAYNSYTQQMTANNSMASSWASNVDMASMPDWAQPLMAENVMYMRTVLAMNPDIVNNGSVDLSSTASTPMMVPQDMAAALASAGSSTGSSSAGSTATGAAPAASSSDPAQQPAGAAAANQPNGASSLASSKMVVGAAAVIATFFLL